MPFEIFAEKVKVLPPRYYAELMDYLEFLVAKSQMQEKKENIQNTDEFSRFREIGLEAVRELTKDDTW